VFYLQQMAFMNLYEFTTLSFKIL